MLKRKTLPYFVHSLFQLIKSCVDCSVVKIKYVSESNKSKSPVMGFHVTDYELNSVTN